MNDVAKLVVRIRASERAVEGPARSLGERDLEARGIGVIEAGVGRWWQPWQLCRSDVEAAAILFLRVLRNRTG
jgi:hypothetical protein